MTTLEIWLLSIAIWIVGGVATFCLIPVDSPRERIGAGIIWPILLILLIGCYVLS